MLILFFYFLFDLFFLIYFDMNSLTKKTINPVINNKTEFIFIPLLKKSRILFTNKNPDQ